MPDGLIKLFGSITVAENEAYNQAIAWVSGNPLALTTNVPKNIVVPVSSL